MNSLGINSTLVNSDVSLGNPTESTSTLVLLRLTLSRATVSKRPLKQDNARKRVPCAPTSILLPASLTSSPFFKPSGKSTGGAGQGPHLRPYFVHDLIHCSTVSCHTIEFCGLRQWCPC